MTNDGSRGLGTTTTSTYEFGTYRGIRGSSQSADRGTGTSIGGEADMAPVDLEDAFASDMWDVFDEAGLLLLKKHESYGPGNIANAPGGPANGLRVRMHDKMARLNHIIDHPGVDTNGESLDDTLIDLLNYCAIFLMVRKGAWPAIQN